MQAFSWRFGNNESNPKPGKLDFNRGDTFMTSNFTIANFKHVADGLQEGQFGVGARKKASRLDDLDPIYRNLLDQPITATLGLIGPDGQVNLTPMWFDYAEDKILVNTAEHRPKCQWIRDNPNLTVLLVNPDNPYHWISIKCTVANEIREKDPGGEVAAQQVDKIWTKYTGQDPPYGLRDPEIDEKRVLFECEISRIATFGKP